MGMPERGEAAVPSSRVPARTEAGRRSREGGGDSVLADLWRRRGGLSAEETVDLYHLVRAALASYRPPELHALAEDREELVAQFVYLKVLRLDDGRQASGDSDYSAPSTAYAVCAYFRRYLIDCLRSAGHQRCVSMEVDGIARQAERGGDGHVADPVHACLEEYGLSEARVLESARSFVDSLERPDQLLLSGGLGHLAQAKGGLSQVASRYKIASYHYRAGKLGIVLKKGALPSAFAQTRIGTWIQSELGIPIQPDSRDAIQCVLGLLAVQAAAD